MRIELSEAGYAYGKKRKRMTAPSVLTDITLTIERGEMLAIAGKSGSGKSTLLQLIKGFIAPSPGVLKLEGYDPHAARKEELFDRIGFIFQYPEHQLFAASVFEDIAFGLKAVKLPPEQVESKVRLAMEAVQLDYERYKDRSPFELSGGEKRRVAIAGVIVLEPEVLILDEPTAGLDLQAREALFQLLERLNRKRQMTVIWVSHQLEEIAARAERLIVIKDGRLAADGAPSLLLSDAALLHQLGWEEPPSLAVSRLLRELGIADRARPLTPTEAAAAIAGHIGIGTKLSASTSQPHAAQINNK